MVFVFAGCELQLSESRTALPKMRQLLRIAFLLLISFAITFTGVGLSRADELDDVTADLARQQQQLSDLERRQQQLSRDISSASLSLSQVSIQLTAAEDELAGIESDLTAKEAELVQQEDVRDALIRQLYIQSRISAFEIALSSEDLGESARQLQYYNENLRNLSETVGQLTEQVTIFQSNKDIAQKIRDDLAALRDQYQATVTYSRRQLSSTSSQLSSVRSTIQNLTAQQEQLILAKFAQTSQSETVGNNEPVSTPLPAPEFSPAFAFATFGYPHRVGMSQYGAYGRSKAGQSYPQILAAYYQNTALGGSCDKSRRINVQGYGEILLEDEYLTGIGEMPASWGSSGGMEALKAQVVAARSYALDYVNRAGSICTTTSCQVFLGPGAKNGTLWQAAVDQTCGQVLTYGGAPIAAYYASTAGGYTLSSQEVWGGYRAWAQRLKDFGPNGAYDGPNYGNSPWYHKAWGSRTGSGYNPWMTDVEVADIFNAARLSAYSSSYNPYLSPPYNTSSPGWSIDQVKNELRNLGIPPLEKVTAVVTTFAGDGFTTASVYGCDGSNCMNFSGTSFRAMFNLRSIGSLVIWTSLFDLIRP